MTMCNKFVFICILLIYTWCCYYIKGFSLFPHGVTYMCGGEQVSLTCVTNGNFLEWNIMISSYDYLGGRLISSSGTPNIPPLTVYHTTFSFVRESSEPLNVTLSAINATVDMKIFCIQYLQSENDTLLTTINVVSSESDISSFLSDPDLIMTQPSLEENNVSVVIHLKRTLNEENSSYSVSFTVIPHCPHVHTTIIANNDSATMTISYNTFYNVTVFGAVNVCGYSGALSSVVSLFYANCGAPTPPQQGSLNPYTSTLEGGEINVTCPGGLQEKMTCDSEGNWDPNSTDICNTQVSGGSSAAIAIAVGVTITLSIAIVSIIMISLCIWYCQRKAREARQYAQFTDEDTSTMEQQL